MQVLSSLKTAKQRHRDAKSSDAGAKCTSSAKAIRVLNRANADPLPFLLRL